MRTSAELLSAELRVGADFTSSGMANGIQITLHLENAANITFTSVLLKTYIYIKCQPITSFYCWSQWILSFMFQIEVSAACWNSNKQTKNRFVLVCVFLLFFGFVFLVNNTPVMYSIFNALYNVIHCCVHWILHIIYRMHKRKQHQHNQRWKLNKPKSMLDMETSKFANFSDRKQIAWSTLLWMFDHILNHRNLSIIYNGIVRIPNQSRAT